MQRRAARLSAPTLVLGAFVLFAVLIVMVTPVGAVVSTAFSADACPQHAPGADWVANENKLAGSRDWVPQEHSGRAQVLLYLDGPSLTCGGMLSVRLGGQHATGVRVRVVRVGWYAGSGARTVWTSGAVDVSAAAVPRVREHVVGAARWSTHVTARVTGRWTPGLYLAEALVGEVPVSAAGFVVRSVSPWAPLVVVHSNLTWQAYNPAGHASLYGGPYRIGTRRFYGSTGRAYVVSTLRPTLGLGELLSNDAALAQLTDRLGVPVDHVLDTDLSVRPTVLDGHAGIVLPGHAEYWTRAGYDAVQHARDAGVNILSLGANAFYWQARVSFDSLGDPQQMAVYRSVSLDPAASAEPASATVRWQDQPLNRPVAAFVGEPFVAFGVNGGFVVHRPPSWLVAGTAVHDGSLLAGVVTNEADGLTGQVTTAPADVQVVTEGLLRSSHTAVVVSSSYYSAPSGAGVFDAGVTSWSCAALGTCPDGAVSPSTSLALRGITKRLLWAFSQVRWGMTHPSHRDVPSSARWLRSILPPAAVGTIRGGS